MVDRSAWSLPTWDHNLSVKERAELTTFHEGRRARAAVARVLVKRLFLESPGRGWEASLAPDEAVAVSALTELEVLSGGRYHRHAPMLWRAGSPVVGIGVSMAHSDDATMVMVGDGRVGVDLERVHSRRPEFYRQMFSAEEQRLAVDISGDIQEPVEAVFTLLWCTKEAYLKACGRNDIGVWQFGQWTVTPILSTAAGSAWDTPRGMSTRVRVRGPNTDETGRLLVRRQGDMLSVGLQLPVVAPDPKRTEEREDERNDALTG